MRTIRVFFFLVMLSIISVASYTKERTVVIYNWSEYIPRNVIEDFQKETGIRVIYSTYESNEAMFAKLQIVQGKGYDVLVPSTYVVPLLQNNDLLQKIDTTKLPNLRHIDPYFLTLHGINNTYTVPYMWGVTVLLYNKKAIQQPLTSWNDLFIPQAKDKIFLSDDIRDTFGVALMAQGLSPNATQKSTIEMAAMWLKNLFPSVYIFDVTAQKQAFINEEVLMGTAWNGDAFISITENPNLHAIYPKEGSPMWLDSFAIPKNAKNTEEAYAFINFMLRPDIAARCVQEYFYSTPNKDAIALLPKTLQENALINPPRTAILKMKLITDVGNALQTYEKLWEQLKVAH